MTTPDTAQAEFVFGPHPTQRELAFWRFHRANEHIFNLLRQLLAQARAAGAKVGIRLLWERMRWELALGSVKRDQGTPKLNNNWPPFYARLLMATDPSLDGYFEVRGNAARLAWAPLSAPAERPPSAGSGAALLNTAASQFSQPEDRSSP